LLVEQSLAVSGRERRLAEDLSRTGRIEVLNSRAASNARNVVFLADSLGEITQRFIPNPAGAP